MRPSSSSKTQWIIVGGGLSGLIAAWKLSSAGQTVRVIEAGRTLGGVNQSFEWRGHQIDLGCHFIGNDDDATTNLFLDMLGAAPIPVYPRLGSWNYGQLSLDVEYPDFSKHSQASDFLTGLIEAGAADTATTPDMALPDFLEARFGSPAAKELSAALSKMLGRPLEGLSAQCAPALPIRRLLTCSDEAATLLKTIPPLEDRILQAWRGDTMRFNKATARAYNARAFYPSGGGMGALTAAALCGLNKRGVDIRTGEQIQRLQTNAAGIAIETANAEIYQSDFMLWTAGPGLLSQLAGLTPKMDKHIHGVPMVLYYFDVARDARDEALHYIHDFDSRHLLFRASSPTRWAPHVSPQGRAYLCVEVTTQMTSTIWKEPESYLDRIWQEVVETGMATGNRPADFKIMQTPVSYKLPGVEFEPCMKPLREWLAKHSTIKFSEPFTFAKTKIAQEVDGLVTS